MSSSTKPRASGVVGWWCWQKSSVSCSRSARFSEGRTRDSAWMPVLRAFMEEVALPVTEVGPVDFWALRRFASICRRVDMVAPEDGDRGPRVRAACPYFEDRGRRSGIRGGDVCILLKIGRKDSEMFV